MRKVIPVTAYHIHTRGNEVTAGLMYHDREVVGKAKCHEHDEMDKTIGKEIAIARCEAKLRHARTVHAREELRALKAEIRNLMDRADAYTKRVEARMLEEQEAIKYAKEVEAKYR